ncbi:MAG: VWA domain-containing protein [Pyrinomonadaceae bacterium]
MKYFVFVLLLSITIVSSVFGQSGRKSTATPKPAPTVEANDPSQYSESKPRTPRARSMSDQLLRAAGNNPTQSSTPVQIAVKPSINDDAETLRVETNLITIPVSVFDRNGLYMPNIRQQEFKIFEDGVEQEIAYFGTDDKPFTVALLLDTSPSTEYKIDEIHRAAQAFVDQLKPQDNVIVIEFHGSVKVQSQATNDREKIRKAIYRAKFGEGTSLYNAVDEALRKQLGRISGRKAVVLFTDGVDTTSRKNSYDSTLNYSEESDSLIFPIYYNTYFENRRRAGSSFPDIFGDVTIPRGVTAEEYALGKRYLEDLADATGGRVFRPESTPGGLTAAFEGIAEELRRQYNIGYVPKSEGKMGQRKQIRVRVNRPNLVLRSRDNYVVGAAASAPPESVKPK